jgi:tyrosine-protein kinase Etk/Wzc
MAEQNNGFIPNTNSPKPESALTAGPKDFIFRYLRYIPWVLVSLALFLTLAYIKIRYSTPIYRVSASMLIKNDRASGGRGERFNELFMTEGVSNLSNEIQILKSRPVLQRVARDLSLQTYYYNAGNVKSSLLYPYSPFILNVLSIPDSNSGFGCKITVVNDDKFLLNDSKIPVLFGQPIQIGNSRCILQHNPYVDMRSFGLKYEIGWQPLSAAAENLVGGLTITQSIDQSTILSLTFEGENSKLGRDVLNTLMSVYDSLVVEDKSRIDANTLRFINTQLSQLNDTLIGVQGGLQSFMMNSGIYSIEGQSSEAVKNLGETTKERDAQEIKVGILDWLLNYIGDKKNAFELVPTLLKIEEPSLMQLINEYNRLQLDREANLKTTTPDNPMIVGLETSLDKVRRNIYQALLNVKQSYLITSNNINRHQQELQSNATSLPGKSMHLLNIQRQQRILEELTSLLLQKQLETRISAASTISNSKVVEPAAGGGVQISPDGKKAYTIYFILGLLIPVAIIALIEVMKDKVSGRADVEKYTHAPYLGEVGHSADDLTLVVTKNSRRFISEQFRIIRTNLQYVIAKTEKPFIMVTSSISGEGKSFISTNIGAVMALTDRKTVIMEFDIRKPKIVSGLDLKRKMGITNYIIGNAKFEDLLVKVDGVDNLYVIPCGPIPPNPSELLLDPRLDELMTEVRNRFDVVIMDTAPVGLVSDAVNLGRFADCTIYIIRQGYTFRKQLNMIQELYAQQKLPKLSILLNDVKIEGGYYGKYGGYGYYSGYGYGAESGYFEEEKELKGQTFFQRMKRMRKRWFG